MNAIGDQRRVGFSAFVVNLFFLICLLTVSRVLPSDGGVGIMRGIDLVLILGLMFFANIVLAIKWLGARGERES